MKVSTEPVLIGCELFIRKGDSILLGLRKNIYGAGTWALPGGHLEYNERMIDAASREAKEELGFSIEPANLRLVSIVDGLPAEGNNRHYIHMSFELLDPPVEPLLMEPEECEEWRYFLLNDLPENIFPPHVPIFENYRSGQLYEA